jgi:hypothetical protein
MATNGDKKILLPLIILMAYAKIAVITPKVITIKEMTAIIIILYR